jgi:T5SS/PEP-CTERM-associated repeat protein
VATVDGTNSTWTNSGQLNVGIWSGSGTLFIKNGGIVNSYRSYLSFNSGNNSAMGVAIVEGAGSTWTTQENFFIGSAGSGTLSIAGGGSVAAANLSIYSTSLLNVDVGRGSLLKINSDYGTIINNGMIRILAGAGVPVDDSIRYSPISAGSWGGMGTYQAVGGTWNATGHTFTASSVTSGTSGSAISLNLASVQRTLFDDNGPGKTNWEVGASFVAAPNAMNMTFTATAMSNTTLDLLRTMLPTNKSVLSGWEFSTTNYAVNSSNPVYLSFKVGAGYSADELDLWHYDGSYWMKYVPADLTYDGAYASFTAASFSGYAMTAVPEPGIFALLATGLIGLLAYTWRRRKRGA